MPAHVDVIIIGMNENILKISVPCQHEKHGRCTNHFWKVMRQKGKPGLIEYFCRLRLAQLEYLDAYAQAAERAFRFGLTGEKREKAVARALAGLEQKTSCPDFRQDPARESMVCRYYFMETCLLLMPVCEGACDDYLASGDQRGRQVDRSKGLC